MSQYSKIFWNRTQLYHILRNYERISSLRKLLFAVLVRFLKMPQDMFIFMVFSFSWSFHGHGLFMNPNQHKIIYRLRYKTSNFEKPKLVVTRKLRHFEFGQYHVTEANFQVASGLKKF